MKSQNVLDSKVFGVFFGLDGTSQSEMYFGGYDSDWVKSEKDITWTDLIDMNYWSVPIQKLEYGKDNLNTETERGILDTGSSLVHFRKTDFDKIMSKIKSHQANCNLLVASTYKACYCKSIDDFQNITLKFDKYYYEMIPGHYVVEIDYLGDKVCYFLITSFGDNTFATPSVLLGDSFMRNYYTVHDSEEKRLGLVSIDGRKIRSDIDWLLIALIAVSACCCMCMCSCLLFCVIRKFCCKRKAKLGRSRNVT